MEIKHPAQYAITIAPYGLDDETGKKTLDDKNCYSGKGEHKNNPASQGKEDKGPTPRGKWDLGDKYNSKKTGPFTVRLNPYPDNDVFKTTRKPDTFRLHGDNGKGTASEGCIVCGKVTREKIYQNDGEGAVIIVE